MLFLSDIYKERVPLVTSQIRIRRRPVYTKLLGNIINPLTEQDKIEFILFIFIFLWSWMIGIEKRVRSAREYNPNSRRFGCFFSCRLWTRTSLFDFEKIL